MYTYKYIYRYIWLGIFVFSSRCPCGFIIDSYGDHVLGCGSRSGNLRIKRHDALCDIVFHTLLEDHSGTRREQHCGGYDNSRPGDVYHPDFLLGRPAYFDITKLSILLIVQVLPLQLEKLRKKIDICTWPTWK